MVKNKCNFQTSISPELEEFHQISDF